MTEGIFILLGSNLGDRNSNLVEANGLIRQQIGSLLHESSIYETAAWGKTDQPSFYNQVIQISSSLSPQMLINKTQKIEKELGRVRTEKWGERIIDIDLLYYNQSIINDPKLQVPHAGIPDRRFTLIPLDEIAPDFVHPQLKKTNKQLLVNCNDGLEVKKLKK